MQPYIPSRRSRRQTTAAVVGANLCLIAVVALHLLGFFRWYGAFPELLACGLIVTAVALMFVWLRLKRRPGRLAVPERVPDGERRSAEAAARRLLRRRAIAVRAMLFLGTFAVFALVAGTFGDDPAWRAFAEGDPVVNRVDISSIGDVHVRDGRGGLRYEFDFTGTIPTATSIHIVESEVVSKVDPRATDDWDLLAWAAYDPDRVQITGDVVIADTYGEAVRAARFPLSPVVGIGWYALILLSAAAFSASPSKWIAEVSRSDRLAYYRGDVLRLRRGDVKLLASLALLAAILYTACAMRWLPVFEYPNDLYDVASAEVAIYSPAMHAVALIFANRFARVAIGDARLPDR